MISIADAIQQLFPEASQEQLNSLKQALSCAATIIEAPANSPLFSPGDTCENYLFLLQGQVKVFSSAANGKEILLYRIRPGETCILSTNCMMGSQHYPASARTESDSIALSISALSMQRAMESCPILNQSIMQNFSMRIGSLIELVGEVALERLDVRLARHLLQLSGDTDKIRTTHEDLAKEVGTAREVVTRQLKQFEISGWVETRRGLICILESQPLGDLSEGFFPT